MIKTVLEDVADNLFNPDPYYQQGGDMVRVGGLTYTCTPAEKMGSRISDMRLKGEAIRPTRPTRWPAGRRWPKRPSRNPASSRCGTWSRPG
jgi:2',3'-cyclic-nucleotide 2'-phosphodiesterase (5'-nucleotidase family)